MPPQIPSATIRSLLLQFYASKPPPLRLETTAI
jgi:hypothetical protein